VPALFTRTASTRVEQVGASIRARSAGAQAQDDRVVGEEAIPHPSA
jgi:hypothetical protein